MREIELRIFRIYFTLQGLQRIRTIDRMQSKLARSQAEKYDILQIISATKVNTERKRQRYF